MVCKGCSKSSMFSTISDCTWTLLSVLTKHLFVWHDLLTPCSARHNAACLAGVIKKADSGKLPIPYEMPLHAFSYASTPWTSFMRQAVEFVSSFCTRYLSMHLEDTPCMPMGIHLSTSQKLLFRGPYDGFQYFVSLTRSFPKVCYQGYLLYADGIYYLYKQ